MRAGDLNRYTCERCGGSIVTVDREAGTTPLFLRCRATKGCDGRMVSAMYRGVVGTPTFEWRKPNGAERLRLSGAMRAHVDRGGLVLYPIAGAGAGAAA
jgi:hypothetical protein